MDRKFVALEEEMNTRFVALEDKLDARFTRQDDKFEARFVRLENGQAEISLKLTELIAHLIQTDDLGALSEAQPNSP